MKKNATKTAMQDLLMIFILASASANLLAQEGKLSASTLAPMPPMGCVDLQNGLDGCAGPVHWNDPDMLEVGNGA